MLLDQQVPMEWAFAGPATLATARPPRCDADRGDWTWTSSWRCAAAKPAIHRFPASMGRRIHEVCAVLADEYDGEAENLWRDVPDGAELYARLRALPGFGDEKSKIFVAMLAKRRACAPEGWQDAAGKFGDEVPRSVADIDGPESLAKVREWKQAQKAAKRDKQDRLVG